MLSNFSIDKLQSNGCKLYTFLNPYSYYKINEDIISSFDYIFSDGILLTVMHNIFNKNKISRYSFDFTSLAPIVFNYAVTEGLNVALVGGTISDARKAEGVIRKKYPDIKITSYSGFFDNSNELLQALKENHSEVIVAGMGTPLQEKFLLECSNTNIHMKMGFTCGGFITQIASNPEYFNKTLNTLNLRWLQRFVRHGYVRKRMFFDYPFFIIKYIFSNFFKLFK